MKKVVTVVSVLGIVLLVAFLASPRAIWDGQVKRPISITVRDNDGGIVRNATVKLIQNFDDQLRRELSPEDFSEHLKKARHLFVSDEKGSGVLIGQFGAGGSDGPFRKTGRFVINGDLVVTHEDFFELAAPIANFTGGRTVPIQEDDLEFTVFLKRRETGDQPSGEGDKAAD